MRLPLSRPSSRGTAATSSGLVAAASKVELCQSLSSGRRGCTDGGRRRGERLEGGRSGQLARPVERRVQRGGSGGRRGRRGRKRGRRRRLPVADRRERMSSWRAAGRRRSTRSTGAGRCCCCLLLFCQMASRFLDRVLSGCRALRRLACIAANSRTPHPPRGHHSPHSLLPRLTHSLTHSLSLSTLARSLLTADRATAATSQQTPTVLKHTDRREREGQQQRTIDRSHHRRGRISRSHTSTHSHSRLSPPVSRSSDEDSAAGRAVTAVQQQQRDGRAESGQ